MVTWASPSAWCVGAGGGWKGHRPEFVLGAEGCGAARGTKHPNSGSFGKKNHL